MIDGRKKKICKEFGNNLKKIRKARALSLRMLAAASGLEHKQIARIENGEVNLTLSTIVFLAEALAMDPRDLLS